jgi:trehalose-phosphatase
MRILEHFVDRTPGSFVEEKKYALVWHHRMTEPEFGAWLANELVSMLEAMLAETKLRAFRGKDIVEVKPVWANKGGGIPAPSCGLPGTRFSVSAGDDRTDGSLFERMGTRAWSVQHRSGTDPCGIRPAGLHEPPGSTGKLGGTHSFVVRATKHRVRCWSAGLLLNDRRRVL